VLAAENKKKLKRLFRPAFHAIASMLDADAYERFVTSPDFKEMVMRLHGNGLRWTMGGADCVVWCVVLCS
jgi:hypothetical protein